MNYRKYMKRIEEKLGEIKAADRIHEKPWLEIVMKELNEISKEGAIGFWFLRGWSFWVGANGLSH